MDVLSGILQPRGQHVLFLQKRNMAGKFRKTVRSYYRKSFRKFAINVKILRKNNFSKKTKKPTIFFFIKSQENLEKTKNIQKLQDNIDSMMSQSLINNLETSRQIQVKFIKVYIFYRFAKRLPNI